MTSTHRGARSTPALHPEGNSWLKGFYAFLIFLFAVVVVSSVATAFQ